MRYRKHFCFLLCGLLILVLGAPMTALAAVVGQSQLSDDFNRAQAGSDWLLTDGACVTADSDALRFNPEYSWADQIVLAAYEMTGDCVVQFTVRPFQLTPGYWFAMSFGNRSTFSAFSAADGALIMTANAQNGMTQLFVSDGNQIASSGQPMTEFSPFGFASGVSEYTVRIAFSHTESSTYLIEFSVYNGNTVIGTQQYTAEIRNRYFGFNVNNLGLDVDDVTIYEDGEAVWYDDFSDSTVAYPSDDNEDADWCITGYYTEEMIAAGPIGVLDVSQPGSTAQYAERLDVRPDDSGISYRLSFELYAENMTPGAATGVFLGRSESVQGLFIGIERTESGYRLVSRGASDETGGAIEAASDYAMTVTVSSEGAVTAETEGAVFTSPETAAGGYIAFGTLSGTGGTVDNVRIDTFVWQQSEAPDADCNFSGVKETQENGMTYREYWLSTEDWYYGNGVSLPRYDAAETNGYLQFLNGNVFTAFGPRERYSEYTVRFDITMYDDTIDGVRDGVAFGLSVGRPSLYMSAEQAQTVYFAHYNENTIISSYNAALASGATEEVLREDDQPYDLWRDKSITYQMLYVVRDGEIRIYFKRADEPETALDTLRARFIGVDTYGYVTVVGLNNARFKIENFSLTNLSASYGGTGLSEGHIERLRYDFSSGTAETFSRFRNAEISDGALRLTAGGKVTVAGDVRSAIIRADIGQADGEFRLQIGDGHKISFAADMIRISGFSAYEKRYVPDRSVEYDGASIEVSVYGGTFALSIRQSGRPAADMETPLISFGIGESYRPPRSAVSVSSEGNLAIDSLGVINMDMNRTIQAVDYDPEAVIDRRAPKPLSPETRPYGLIIGLSVGGGALLIGAVAVFVILYRRKKHEKA